MRNSVLHLATCIISLTCLHSQENVNQELAREALKTSNSFLMKEQWDSAYHYSQDAIRLMNTNSGHSWVGKAARISGLTSYKLQLNDSTDYFEIAKKIALKNEDWEELIETYFSKGDCLYDDLEKEESLKYFLKVDSISQQYQLFNPTTVESIIKRAEIARTSFTRESSDYAYRLLMEALTQAKDIGSQESIHLTYVYLCDAAGLKGEIDEAKRYIDLGLAYFLRNDQKRFEKYVTRLYLISTSYYKAVKRVDKAEEAFTNGIRFARQKENELELAKLLYYYGHFQKDILNSCSDAVVSLEEAKLIFDELNMQHTGDYERLNRDLALCNFEFGNFQEASAYFQIAYDLKGDLQKKANRELSRRLETQYQSEKKEQEIALLNSENEVLEQKRLNQRNLLLGGIGITSLAGVFLFFLYRNRQKTNQKLREIDQLKSNFFANISHEFRTPLTLISGPVEKRLESKKLSEKDREEFEMIHRSSGRLLNLVDQLLDLSKLEAGKYNIHVRQGELGGLVRAISESFKFPAKEKDITYDIEVEDIPNAWFDTEMIEKVVSNLLSNAIKYTDDQGTVQLRLFSKNGKATLQVRNSPATIDPGSIERLFDRFFQVDENTEGVGIGLALVKELTELMNGSIVVSQPEDQCISFNVEFSISKTDFKPAEVDELQGIGVKEGAYIPPIEGKTESVSLVDIEITDDKDILLVVEDNADVRQLVRSIFEEQYKVIEATNGKEGIDLALNHIPDLIISDIMMPDVDGLQLLRSLKGDERTSHIPIILLTAKAGEEDQYKGLSTGADAYVTKPFTLKLLEARVLKLVESRKKLRDRYSQEVILKPKDIAITNLDEQFLDRVQEVLDLKLTESDFNVQEFSDAVGLSRMQLHRKLKALTGLSASEFVRSQRLKLAASLLRKSDANVSQIGYEVGFNDPSYFTKCFREGYGVSPSEYSKKQS